MYRQSYHLQIEIVCVFIFILTALSLRCYAWAFSSFGQQGLLFIVVCGLLATEVSLIADHKLQVHRLQ